MHNQPGTSPSAVIPVSLPELSRDPDCNNVPAVLRTMDACTLPSPHCGWCQGSSSHSPWGGGEAMSASLSLLHFPLCVGRVSFSLSNVGKPRALTSVNTTIFPQNQPMFSGQKCSTYSYPWGLCLDRGLTVSFSVVYASPQPVLVVFSEGCPCPKSTD